MKMLSTVQAARVAGIDPRNAGVMVPRLARALDGRSTSERVVQVRWSPGLVVAIAVLRSLDPHGMNPERWAAGARHVGEAHERGLCPAYLVTAGGADYGVLLDAEETQGATARLATRLASDGRVARIVRVTSIVEDLCDVLERRALA